jgi:hypothetical protein
MCLVDNDLIAGIVGGLDLEPLISAMDRRSDDLVEVARQKVRAAIASRDTSELLTLSVARPDGQVTVLAPGTNVEYARTLLTFVRDRKGTGGAISCAAERITDDALREAVVEFYESPEAIRSLSDGIAQRLRDDSAVLAVVMDRVHELRGIVTPLGRTSGAARPGAFSAVTGRIAATAAASSLVLAPAKAAVGQSVLNAAVASGVHGTASAAGKHAVATAAVKSGLAKIAGLAGGHLVLGPVMVAVVGAVLVHEYRAFPTKMADRVSADVAMHLRTVAWEMHRSFLVDYARGAAGVYVSSLSGLLERVADAQVAAGGRQLTQDQVAQLVAEHQLTHK